MSALRPQLLCVTSTWLWSVIRDVAQLVAQALDVRKRFLAKGKVNNVTFLMLLIKCSYERLMWRMGRKVGSNLALDPEKL